MIAPLAWIMRPQFLMLIAIIFIIYLGFIRTGDVLASDWEASKPFICGTAPAMPPVSIEKCISWEGCNINDPTENNKIIQDWYNSHVAEGYGGCQMTTGSFAVTANTGYREVRYACCATAAPVSSAVADPTTNPVPATTLTTTTTTAPLYVDGKPAGFLDKMSYYIKSFFNKIFGVFGK